MLIDEDISLVYSGIVAKEKLNIDEAIYIFPKLELTKEDEAEAYVSDPMRALVGKGHKR